jgi:hypothetical protein
MRRCPKGDLSLECWVTLLAGLGALDRGRVFKGHCDRARQRCWLPDGRREGLQAARSQGLIHPIAVIGQGGLPQ